MTGNSANVIGLALRAFWRDWRAGDLRLLMLAVTLAVAAVSSVGFFADRLQRGLQRDARSLLGGDVVLSSDNRLPPAFEEQAAALGLSTSLSSTFPTMARSDDAQGGQARLVALKAVGSGYPLRGEVRVGDQAGGASRVQQNGPAPGTLWVDPAVLAALSVQVGDAVWLGDARLRVAGVLLTEPDRGAGFMNFAPRVMMNQSDLAATGLVQPASRIAWRLAMAGNERAVAQYAQWAKAALDGGQVRGARLESLESGRPEMQQTMNRAQKFLNLVALLAALLSAVAVAMASRGFADRHLDSCALLRVLGLSQARMAAAYLMEFGAAGLLASLAGVVVGLAVQSMFVTLLGSLVEVTLPAPGGWPGVTGVSLGLVLMVAFGVPPVLQLAKVPAVRVIRRDVGALRPASVSVLALGVAGFAALLLAISGDPALGFVSVGGFAAAVGIFAVVSFLMLLGLRAVVRDDRAPRWLILAVRQVSARRAHAVVQVTSLALGLLALLLLVVLRTDLVASWRQATPPDAPNRFVINVQPDQADDFRAHLKAAGVTRYDWYPMFRGRLVSVNGKPVSPDSYGSDRAKRLVDREFNLSNAARMPEHNRLVEGDWVEGDGVSVEEGLATTLGLRRGDRLGFDIGGQVKESTITSLRKVDWGSLRVNFFVMYPVASMEDMPLTYIAAFRAPGAAVQTQGMFDNALVRAFPNITSVDMSGAIEQAQQILGQVIGAVELLFGFTLAAGVVVLLASVSATRGQREREFAIMRAVGASSRLLRQVQRAELMGVGALAGMLASLVSMGVSWALARHVFELPWVPRWWLPLAGAMLGAAAAAWLAGWWGLRSVLRTPVVETLRKAHA